MVVTAAPPTYWQALGKVAETIDKPAPVVNPPRQDPPLQSEPQGGARTDLERQGDKLDHSFRRWVFGGCTWFSVLWVAFMAGMLVWLIKRFDGGDDSLSKLLIAERVLYLFVGCCMFFLSIEIARYGDHKCHTDNSTEGCVPCKRQREWKERERARRQGPSRSVVSMTTVVRLCPGMLTPYLVSQGRSMCGRHWLCNDPFVWLNFSTFPLRPSCGSPIQVPNDICSGATRDGGRNRLSANTTLILFHLRDVSMPFRPRWQAMHQVPAPPVPIAPCTILDVVRECPAQCPPILLDP